jgi:hypothetical protein
MTYRNKTVLRAAVRIHDRLTRSDPETVSVGMLNAASNLCLDLARRIRKAEAWGWYAATNRLRRELATSLDQLRDCVADIRRAIDPSPSPPVMPAPHVYDDVLALHREFDEVEIDLHQSKITCQTAPIELEDVYLGPFNIVLDINGIGCSDSYEVIAVDPFPATCNDNVTHPHVDGDRLCAGDARVPIKNALWQGRLFDFFLIVRQTLETYNPASAYVELGDWNGQRCQDCDGRAEDPFTCRACSARLCDECVSECLGCDAIACSACKTNCEVCHEPYCSECLTPCDTCKASICEECSINGQCQDCDRKERAADAALVEEPTAIATVYPDGVGQARFSA